MATRTFAIDEVKGFGDYAHVVSWSGLLNGDDGSVLEMPGHTVRSVQFAGTLGVGGTIALEGSNDGVTYYTLTVLPSTVLLTT